MTFKLAIVGSSRAPESAYDFVKMTITKFVKLNPDIEIVSGGAKGIDSLAERVAVELGLKSTIFKPSTNDWLGVNGFRDRNTKIAKYADMVISMPLSYTGNECYHCHTKTHDKTAGCWTANYAVTLDKPMAVVVIPPLFVKTNVPSNVQTNSSNNITSLPPNNIFVFGSNTAGWHGLGSAKLAHIKFGAVYYKGVGFYGQSYAIPTKEPIGVGNKLQTLPLKRIEMYVCEFLEFAKNHPELTFHVTEIGCGLAGYSHDNIAPMFKGYTDNVLLPISFWNILNKK